MTKEVVAGRSVAPGCCVSRTCSTCWIDGDRSKITRAVWLEDLSVDGNRCRCCIDGEYLRCCAAVSISYSHCIISCCKTKEVVAGRSVAPGCCVSRTCSTCWIDGDRSKITRAVWLEDLSVDGNRCRCCIDGEYLRCCAAVSISYSHCIISCCKTKEVVAGRSVAPGCCVSRTCSTCWIDGDRSKITRAVWLEDLSVDGNRCRCCIDGEYLRCCAAVSISYSHCIISCCKTKEVVAGRSVAPGCCVSRTCSTTWIDGDRSKITRAVWLEDLPVDGNRRRRCIDGEYLRCCEIGRASCRESIFLCCKTKEVVAGRSVAPGCCVSRACSTSWID